MNHSKTSLPFVILAFSITGCSLPMNQPEQEQQVKVYAEHWINEPQAKQMLTQGLTA